MQIAEILSQERIACNVDVRSKKRALEAISELLSSASDSLSSQQVFESLLNRERLGSTGLGNGIAIPHGRIAGCQNPVGAFVRLSKAVDFDAIDNQPVDLMFAVLVPPESADQHLHILASLAETLSQPESTAALRETEDRDAVLNIFDGR